MANTRKTEKEVEIHEFYVIRSTSGSLPALCSECASGDAIMITPEQAAALAQIPLRSIYRGLETGLIHYKEGADSSLVVCLKSLTVRGNQIFEGR